MGNLDARIIADLRKAVDALEKRVCGLEEGYREILHAHDSHAGAVPSSIVSLAREKLGQPEAQETREPEE